MQVFVNFPVKRRLKLVSLKSEGRPVLVQNIV